VAVVADLGGLADDDAHAVVDDDAPADGRGRMDLDAGEEANDLREHARRQPEARCPRGVRDGVRPDGVQARVTEQYLEAGLRGGVRVVHCGDVLADASDDGPEASDAAHGESRTERSAGTPRDSRSPSTGIGNAAAGVDDGRERTDGRQHRVVEPEGWSTAMRSASATAPYIPPRRPATM